MMTADIKRPTITVCGLGPGAPDLITARTAEILEGNDPLFLRTARHPGARRWMNGAHSFDSLYDTAASFGEVYAAITSELVEAALATGRVTYCVPGSPLILERTVGQLRDRDDVAVDLVPAVSFLDEVWAKLAVDPVDDGVRLIDGHRFAAEAAGERGPLLVAHAHARWVLSDIKLALLESDGSGDEPVVVLQRLGTDQEAIFEVAIEDLDRRVEADHLTSLYLPVIGAPVGGALVGSVELMRRLRLECPWDAKQDHSSLRKYLLEEAYEVLDVLDRIVELSADSSISAHGGGMPGDSPGFEPDGRLLDAFDDLESELGDLWLQILFHSRLASEAGHFDVSDVATTLTNKMVGRHPHVFGTDNPDLSTSATGDGATAAAVEAQWDQLKAGERTRSSVVDGVPTAMPALARAAKITKRVAGEYGPPRPGPWALALGIDGGTDPEANDVVSNEADLGRLLMAVVEVARSAGLDAEQALRRATNDLVETIERHAGSADLPDNRAGTRPAPLSWVVG